MKHNQYEVKVKVWLYPGDAAWHFVSLPKDVSEDIKNLYGDRARGWGSLPVEVTIGATIWNTSIFPDRKEGAYMLPLKAAVRKQEHIAVGDIIQILVEIKV